MPRRTTLAIGIGFLLLAGTAATADHPAPAALAAQEEEPPPPPPQLTLGERFEAPAWALEVQNAFVVPSPIRARYSEVRATVAFRNLSGATMIFGRAALGDRRAAYPQLQARDAAEVIHPLPLLRPDETSVPGSNLNDLPHGVTARWTVGFQVPTIYSGTLFIEALDTDGNVIASWNVRSPAEPLAGWGAPEGMTTMAMGSAIQWTDELQATPVGFGTILCGNPALEHAVLVFGLRVSVQNVSHTDALWTGIKYPRVPAIALWGDGASAHFVYETSFVDPDPLDRHSFEEVVIPPHLDADGEGIAAPPEDRGMLFSVPRDGRLGAAEVPPQAVVFYPPEGDPLWMPVTGAPTVAVSGEVCDDYDDPPVYFPAFTPSIDYAVSP